VNRNRFDLMLTLKTTRKRN